MVRKHGYGGYSIENVVAEDPSAFITAGEWITSLKLLLLIRQLGSRLFPGLWAAADLISPAV